MSENYLCHACLDALHEPDSRYCGRCDEPGTAYSPRSILDRIKRNSLEVRAAARAILRSWDIGTFPDYSVRIITTAEQYEWFRKHAQLLGITIAKYEAAHGIPSTSQARRDIIGQRISDLKYGTRFSATSTAPLTRKTFDKWIRSNSSGDSLLYPDTSAYTRRMPSIAMTRSDTPISGWRFSDTSRIIGPTLEPRNNGK